MKVESNTRAMASGFISQAYYLNAPTTVAINALSRKGRKIRP